jgi:hypothetical protein
LAERSGANLRGEVAVITVAARTEEFAGGAAPAGKSSMLKFNENMFLWLFEPEEER